MSSRAKRSGDARHYGAPTSPPVPGQTTRKRPKPGDKDPNYKKPTRPPSRKKPEKEGAGRRTPAAKPPKKDDSPGYNRRDYRGVDGAVEDAEKGKKK